MKIILTGSVSGSADRLVRVRLKDGGCFHVAIKDGNVEVFVATTLAEVMNLENNVIEEEKSISTD